MLPPQHPQRIELNDEVHARPPEQLAAPLRLSYLALAADAGQAQRQWRHLGELAARFGVAPPDPRSNHYSADFGAFRVKSERHTEFVRYKIIVPGVDGMPFDKPASAALPPGWIEELEGQVLVAAHAAFLPAPGALDIEGIAAGLFDGNTLVGASIAGGAGAAFTDFRIRDDGFSRLLVFDRGLTPRQAGRMMQRLVEIETYRMLALLALPLARALSPHLSAYERELAGVSAAMGGSGLDDEPALLDRLTRLEADIDSREAEHHYRFSASRAYYDLVRRRIAELREERLPGLQTFGEFMERRLAPAMATCASASNRLAALSERVARATQLLSTRVAVTQERQNQEVLATMSRRVALQLRLQQTVEGLSVAAITYYVVGLVGYLAKGVSAAGLAVSPDLLIALSIPLVLLVTALGLRRIRHHATRLPP